MSRSLFLTLICLSLFACEKHTPSATTLDQHAEQYLILELAMGELDKAHVDAYFGPETLREQAKAQSLSFQQIDERANELSQQLEAFAVTDAERVRELRHRLTALRGRIAVNVGATLSFDEESMALFAATAPHHEEAYFQKILDEIELLLPGEGALSDRVEDFRARFAIPSELVPIVFEAAMAECRKRTLEHIDLPANESFKIEYVTDKPWSGYNWYQGNSQSLIQVNVDLPIQISRAVDLGCHEGYPGHHTFNALVERELVEKRGWLEHSLYPLFSPVSLVAEGSGNYGIELAFPGEERVAFERDVLFGLAGLDASVADTYYALLALLAKLNYAGNEAARAYINGTMSGEQAQQWLVRYSLTSPERAAQRVRFFDAYRSYVINYNLGKDLVAAYVERDGADMDERWRRFTLLLSEPMNAPELN